MTALAIYFVGVSVGVACTILILISVASQYRRTAPRDEAATVNPALYATNRRRETNSLKRDMRRDAMHARRELFDELSSIDGDGRKI